MGGGKDYAGGSEGKESECKGSQDRSISWRYAEVSHKFANDRDSSMLMSRPFGSGVWNETEAWPLMIKSGQAIGALPKLDEKLSWLPVDLAAKAILEVVTVPDNDSSIYHIVNPDDSAIFANEVLSGLKQAGIQFEAVDRREWLKRLAASEDDLTKNPGKKLLVSLPDHPDQTLAYRLRADFLPKPDRRRK